MKAVDFELMMDDLKTMFDKVASVEKIDCDENQNIVQLRSSLKTAYFWANTEAARLRDDDKF